MYEKFHQAGFRFFGIRGVTDGVCDCGNPKCTALYKHPWFNSWQYTPEWSDEQLEVMQEAGQLEHGYGVLVSGHLLVIDIDARNGGVASYRKLLEDVPDIAGAGLIVETGSGGGSKHLYFRAPQNVSLVQHHEKYPGIDFKSTGYVVGPGSMHISGNRYRAVHGDPDEIEDAPEALIDLLRRPEFYRAAYDGTHIDVTEADIAAMLSHVSADCDHETWIKTGMAIHHATGGSGFDLWDQWSASAAGRYPGKAALEKRWHSFGKSANPVTIGTLIHFARNGGWQPPVTFDPGDQFADYEEGSDGLPFDLSGIDLLRPPGFVGTVTAWLNRQGISKREHIAVATALTAIGNIAGLRYTEDLTDISLNLFCFCVAGSGSGKEAMLSGFNKLHIAAGLGAAVHGNFKSEQELITNIIHHQAAFYAVDEVGTVLSKIENARKRGGAAYLDGLVGQLMSVYSKARGNFLLTGDRKREVREMLQKEYARLSRIIEENEDKTGMAGERLESIKKQLENIEARGLVDPFLSMIGFTTPETFNGLVTPDFVKNGFMSRALFFEEPDNNPRPRGFSRPEPMPESIANTIAALANGGSFAIGKNRIEYTGERSVIQTDDAARAMLEKVIQYFWELGEKYKESNGFEAVTRRGYELTSKVSAILAAPSGIRTVEHVRWAFALVQRDVNNKALLAFSNDEDRGEDERLMTRILTRISEDHGETVAVLANRIKGTTKEAVQNALKVMQDRGLVECREETNYRHTTERWYRV